MRQRHLAHLGTECTQLIGRTIRERADLRVERCREVFDGSTDDDTRKRQTARVARLSFRRVRAIIGHRRIERGGIEGIVPRDDLQTECRIIDGAAEDADLLERRGEGDEPVSTDPTVGRLHADDAAERRRLPHRAAGLGPKRHAHDATGHRDGGAAG